MKGILAASLVLVGLVSSGCSVRKLAADRLGTALASGSSTWGEDDDPELIAEAMPFALKTLEGLVAASPANDRLLLATCRGFASYAAGFVEPEAEDLPAAEFARATALRERAMRLHLRARGYCRRALARALSGGRGGARRRAARGARPAFRGRASSCSTGPAPPGARRSRSASTAPS